MHRKIAVVILLECVVQLPQTHLAEIIIPPLNLNRLVCPGLCTSEIISLAVLNLLADWFSAAVEAAVMNAAAVNNGMTLTYLNRPLVNVAEMISAMLMRSFL